MPELPAFKIKFFLNLYPKRPLPNISHFLFFDLILIPNLLIIFIALCTSSEFKRFVAEHLPWLKDENNTNLILNDLSPSTVIFFFFEISNSLIN